ncbi:esterase family protein [Verrucomicrobia bacterium S94]|nr:esterase family protein [Verrucomicrobia bacterium S94]
MSKFRTTECSDATYERDHLRFITVKSPALGHRANLSLFLPENHARIQNLPLLILLHGVYGSHWVWPFKAGAHITAHEMISSGEIQPLAIVMPSDGLWREGSGYLTHEEANFEAWITEDVIDAVKENIPDVTAQSKICISGLSMGGYGALRLGAKYPELFSAVSAHSSITDFPQLSKFVDEPLSEYRLKDSDNTLSAYYWIQKNRRILPPLRFDCGVDDLLIEENRKLHQQLKEADIPHIYEEFEGEHSWPYWTLHLRDTLRFINHCI